MDVFVWCGPLCVNAMGPKQNGRYFADDILKRTFMNKYISIMIHISLKFVLVMGVIASQITSLTIVYSTVYSGADQRKHESSALLAFVWGIHRGPVNSPHTWPATQKMFPFDDVIMNTLQIITWTTANVVHWRMYAPSDLIIKSSNAIYTVYHLHGIFLVAWRSFH